MKKLNILVVFDTAGTPPADQNYTEEFKKEDWYAEAAVVETLGCLGHSVSMLGIYDDIRPLVERVTADRPDIVFNLTEHFMGRAHYDKHIPAVLEMLGVPYTGCGPGALMLCNNKALTKSILTFHRIKAPQFHTFYRGKRVRLPKRLAFPLMVKPLREEASTGIAQASYVSNEEQLQERVLFVHEKLGMNAIAEEYIDGRELYVSVVGDQRLLAFPIREMVFANTPEGEPTIATFKAKWDPAYREKWGITNKFSTLDPKASQKILETCKRAFRALHLDGYVRFDCRLKPSGLLYILEANGNPDLAQDDEFAESAEKGGYPFDKLLSKLITMGLQRDQA